jgi:DNA-binding transcriptional ArsR family regulator
LDTGTKVERVIEGVSELFEVGEEFTAKDLQEGIGDVGKRTIERALGKMREAKIIDFTEAQKNRKYWRRE